MRFFITISFFVTQSLAGLKRSSSHVSDEVSISRSVQPRPIDYKIEYESFVAAADFGLLDEVEKDALISAEESELLYSVRSRPDLVLQYILDEGWEFDGIYNIHSGNMMFFYNQIAASLGVAPRILSKGLIALNDALAGQDDGHSMESDVQVVRAHFPFTMVDDELQNAIADDWTIVPLLSERTGPCLDKLKEARGSIPLSEALEIGIQLIGILEKLHTVGHLLHGNLDPSKICQSFGDSSKFVLTHFRDSLVVDPNSGEEVKFNGWDYDHGFPIKYRFSSLWELFHGNPYGPRDDLHRLIAIILWLSQPQPVATPEETDDRDTWYHWKTRVQFQDVQNLNRNKLNIEYKRALIDEHSGLIRSLFSMARGAKPSYQEFINRMRAIKHILEDGSV